MAGVRERLREFGYRRLGLSVLVVVFLALFAFFLRQLALFPIIGWSENAFGLAPPDVDLTAHRLHDMGITLLFWTAAIGLLAQLRRPQKNAGGQLMALIPWIALLVAFALTSFWDPVMIVGIFGTVTLLATIVHPSGRDLLRSFRGSRVSTVLLVLVILAAIPLGAYAMTQVGLQTGAIEPAHDHAGAGHGEEVHQDHVDAGHFAIMVAVGLTVIGTGLLASLRPDGWWVPAWVAGLIPIAIGVLSIVYPDAASTVGSMWAVAAILWGLVFIGVAEYTQPSDAPTLLGSRGSGSPPEPT